MHVIFGSITFAMITGNMIWGDALVLAQTDVPPPDYSIWVDGLVHFDGDDGKPAGMSCDQDAPPIVDMVKVADGRWRVTISCTPKT
jgi:hypothetical protein